jgi:hypothetical protein
MSGPVCCGTTVPSHVLAFVRHGPDPQGLPFSSAVSPWRTGPGGQLATTPPGLLGGGRRLAHFPCANQVNHSASFEVQA